MIHVIATVELHDGKRDDFLTVFNHNLPNVVDEDGCLAYNAAVDLETDIAVQEPVRPNVVTIVEQWESLDHLKAHLNAPHMATYRESVKDLVKGVSLQILQPA